MIDFDMGVKTQTAIFERYPHLTRLYYDPILIPVWVGMEIEVKWSAYYPTEYELFLKGRRWKDLDPLMQQHILERIRPAEEKLHLLFEELKTCGICYAQDAYKEFILPPTRSGGSILNIVQSLRSLKALPAGQHALHITIGGIRLNRDTYHLLMAIEMILTNPRRIREGISLDRRSVGWSRKGRAGAFPKYKYTLQGDRELIYDEEAVEFRLFVLDPIDLDPLEQALKLIARYFDLQEKDPQRWASFKDFQSYLLEKNGLPDRLWANPSEDPDIWLRFAEKLQEIQGHHRLVMSTLF